MLSVNVVFQPHSPSALDKFPPENGICLCRLLRNITYASKGKQCGPKQTAPDIYPHCLPLSIYKPIMSEIFAAEGLSLDTFCSLPVTSLAYFHP